MMRRIYLFLVAMLATSLAFGVVSAAEDGFGFGTQRELRVILACNNPVFVREIFEAEKRNDLDRADSLFADRFEEEKCVPVSVSGPLTATPKNFLSPRIGGVQQAKSSCVLRGNNNVPGEAGFFCMIEAEISQPTGTYVDTLNLNPPGIVYLLVLFQAGQQI